MLGECIRMIVPELVPSTPPPPLPEVVFEDDLILLVNKTSWYARPSYRRLFCLGFDRTF